MRKNKHNNFYSKIISMIPAYNTLSLVTSQKNEPVAIMKRVFPGSHYIYFSSNRN